MKAVVPLVFAASLAVAGCVGTLQERYIFPASRDMAADPSEAGLRFENVWLAVHDHQTHAWYVPLENARGVVLFSHGNSGNLSWEIESIVRLRNFGFSVFAYDYGGYGRSTGRPSEARCYADIRAAWAYLTEDRGVPEADILLFGRSLGAAPTVELARTTRPGAVILESAFLSVADVARETSMKALAGLVRHEFDNESKIGAIGSPVLIVHSPEDDVVPYAHSRRLYERAPAPKDFLAVSGGHTTARMTADPAYRPGWEGFLAPIFGPNPHGAAATKK